MNNNRLQKMADALLEGLVSEEQVQEIFDAILKLVEETSQKQEKVLDEQDAAIKDFGEQIATIFENTREETSRQAVAVDNLTSKIEELKKEIDAIVTEDGEDADEEAILETVLDVMEDKLEEIRGSIPTYKEKTRDEMLEAIGEIPLERIPELQSKLQEMNTDMHKLGMELVNITPRVEIFDEGTKVGSVHRINFSGATVENENGRVKVTVTGGDSLPDQTGNNGKYLTTNGTTASWATLAGGGDMAAATYDPATISEQLVGLTATQTLTNKTLTQPTLTLKQSAAPTPTAEGDIQWDTDDNKIKIGDGAATKTFSDDSYNASTFAAASHSHATSDITSGTFDDARIAQSNVTQHQAALSITESQISDLDHTDANAIHDNVAGEISVITAKTTPVSGDFFLIEDSAATNAKKALTFGNLQANLSITESQISDLGAYITGITGEPLSDLSDVTITTIASGEVLKWNGTAWVNNTLAEAGIAPAASPTFTGTVTLPTGLTGVIRADSGVVSVDTDVTDIVAAASTSASGKVELATTAETNTGTDTGRAVTPDGLAGSVFGTKSIGIQVTDGSAAIATGDGKAYFRVPAAMNGMNITAVAASLTAPSTSGTPTVMIARGRQAAAGSAHSFVDVLSTAITIDANEYDSKDATTAAVINGSNDDLATGDLLRIDVDGVGSGPTAVLSVNIEAQLP